MSNDPSGLALYDIRREYAMATLDESSVTLDPTAQFQRWFLEVRHAGVIEPNAMTLATCTADGHPSARVVLLKEVDARGFTFFTDFRSRKGEELTTNPRAALCFLWKEVERQVRVTGSVTRVASDEAEAYFRTRPSGSQVGAWASHQSAVIPQRATLERAVTDVTTRFGDSGVPLPPHWGGFRVAPDEVEFWQGRPNRLHDRLRYRRDKNAGAWVIERLSP